MTRWLAAAVLALAAWPAPARPPADSPETHIRTILAVGPEGDGNAEAARAWKALAKGGEKSLLPILRAMSDENLRGANWLRPAFEAAAARARASGKLPKAELEAFAKDTRNQAISRRLAYEWVVKADPSAPERLLPGMIKDPSPDLRRDAVARLIKAGAASLKVDERTARKAYQEALSGACDSDQVDAIAAALKKLGVTVDLQKHYGVVASWHLAAPFEHKGRSGWNVAYPPEKGVDLKATYTGKDGAEVKWVPVNTRDAQGLVDINKELKQYKGAVAYAHAVVESPAARDVWLRAGCINGLKIFVNGKPVFAREEYHHGMRFDQYAVKVPLKEGRNELLLKVCQNEQTEDWAQKWMFQLRISDFTGAAVPFRQKEAK